MRSMLNTLAFTMLFASIGASEAVAQGGLPSTGNWTASIDCGTPPDEDHHYELDQDCINALDNQYFEALLEAGQVRANAIGAANTLFEADKAHAIEQRNACIAGAAGDPRGIALCNQWYDTEMRTAQSQLEGAIATANAVHDSVVAQALAQTIAAGQGCCRLTANADEGGGMLPFSAPSGRMLDTPRAALLAFTERQRVLGASQLSIGPPDVSAFLSPDAWRTCLLDLSPSESDSWQAVFLSSKLAGPDAVEYGRFRGM